MATTTSKMILDENRRPKITKEEMDKGMLNMIYKGLIPKYADLTPGFHRDGNPMKTTSNLKDMYGKKDSRAEIESDTASNIKYNFDQKNASNFFITDKINSSTNLIMTNAYNNKPIKEEQNNIKTFEKEDSLGNLQE